MSGEGEGNVVVFSSSLESRLSVLDLSCNFREKLEAVRRNLEQKAWVQIFIFQPY